MKIFDERKDSGKTGIPLLIFKGLAWAKDNGKEKEYWEEHSRYFKRLDSSVGRAED